MSTEGLRFRFSCADTSSADFVSIATALRAAMFLDTYTPHTHTPTHKQAHSSVLLLSVGSRADKNGRITACKADGAIGALARLSRAHTTRNHSDKKMTRRAPDTSRGPASQRAPATSRLHLKRLAPFSPRCLLARSRTLIDFIFFLLCGAVQGSRTVRKGRGERSRRRREMRSRRPTGHTACVQVYATTCLSRPRALRTHPPLQKSFSLRHNLISTVLEACVCLLLQDSPPFFFPDHKIVRKELISMKSDGICWSLYFIITRHFDSDPNA